MNTHKHTNRWIAAIAAICLSQSLMAQNTNGGYFTEGYLYRHESNPAIANDQSYFSIPGVGNLNVAMRGNLAVDKILYNVNGKTTTFLNPGVSADEFLSGLKDKNKVGADIRLDIISVGFKGFNGYNTIGINVRSSAGAKIPGSLLRLAKEGPENKSYDISDLELNAQAYAELALGHSHQINDQLRIGATLKFLFGGANMQAKFNKAQLTLGQDDWEAVTNAEVHASVKGFKYETETKERYVYDGNSYSLQNRTYVNDVDVDGTGLNGFGMGIDLGAEYKINDDWKVSASLLDIGFISWSNDMLATTNGDKYFHTDQYIFNADGDADNKFSREMDRLRDGLATLYELDDMGDQGGRTTGLGATLNLAGEYTLPSYRKLTFGALSTTRFGTFGWTDFRLSANVAPTNIFSASTSFGIGTYGASFGWLLNFHPKGFNIYLGMDHTMGKVAKQMLPLSSNAHVNFGINIPL